MGPLEGHRQRREGPDSGAHRRPLVAADPGRTDWVAAESGTSTEASLDRYMRARVSLDQEEAWEWQEVDWSGMAQILHPQFLGSHLSSMTLSHDLETVTQSLSISFFVKRI